MFRAKRIPGSIRFECLKHALDTLDPKEEVIVYRSHFGCELVGASDGNGKSRSLRKLQSTFRVHLAK